MDVPPSHADVNFVALSATAQAGLNLYRDANYTGIHEPYRGDNPDLNNACIGVRTVSSLKVCGNYIAVLYREPNYQGTSETFTGNDADLSNNIARR